MYKKTFAISLTAAVMIASLFIVPVFASNNIEKPEEKQFEPVTIPFEQKQPKEVVDRLYKTWNKGIDKISEKEAKNKINTFKKDEWKLIYGFDIDRNFTNHLSETEAQAFYMALDEAKKVYQPGDSQYGILLSNDEKTAKVIWERANGDIHVAELSSLKTLNNEKSLVAAEDSSVRTIKWTLASEEDLK